MHCIRPIISTQRLQRFHRWALLWLTWFAAVIEYGAAFAPLSRQAKALAHEYLDQIERLIVAIVIIRAGAAIFLNTSPSLAPPPAMAPTRVSDRARALA